VDGPVHGHGSRNRGEPAQVPVRQDGAGGHSPPDRSAEGSPQGLAERSPWPGTEPPVIRGQDTLLDHGRNRIRHPGLATLPRPQQLGSEAHQLASLAIVGRVVNAQQPTSSAPLPISLANAKRRSRLWWMTSSLVKAAPPTEGFKHPQNGAAARYLEQPPRVGSTPREGNLSGRLIIPHGDGQHPCERP
jgi:hypothetical protein